MKTRLFVDGNIAGWAQLVLIVLGIAMVYCGLVFNFLPNTIAILLIVFGLPISAIGGYASRAKALGLKPFDKSYRRARDSYKTKDDEENRSK
ncbi:hypothetical protein [Burkholderia territorii]|uniref:hypothetical protein n=1 Tax=Burkholderia territorii TaxID=1503055 RepID=UPI0009BEB43F|nr:hypothetical protein [Burkholderia territorii]